MTPELKRRVLSLLTRFPTESEVKLTKNMSGELQYSNTNKMIAKQLGVAERTVKAYVARIAKSWGIEGRDGLVMRQRIVYLEAMHAGLVPPLEMSPKEALNQLADCFVQRRLPAGAETLLKRDRKEARGKTQKNGPPIEPKPLLKGAAFTKFLKDWAEHNSAIHQQTQKNNCVVNERDYG